MVAKPATRIGFTGAAMGGTVAGGLGGAYHGVQNRQPGQSTMQAAMGGAAKGALVGAGGALVGRHFLNKGFNWAHAKKMRSQFPIFGR